MAELLPRAASCGTFVSRVNSGGCGSACAAAVFLLVSFSLAGVTNAFGSPALPNYFTRVWQTTDGLPDNNVTSVVQTRDGYLWIGTRSGLARFDGVRFTVFDTGNTPEMENRHVTSLFEANDGTLWIGHESGNLTSYKDGKFHSIPVQGAWHGGKIFAISADSKNDVWFLSQKGELVRVRDGRVISASGGTTVHLLAWTRVSNTRLFIQRDSEVSSVEDGQLKVEYFDGETNRYIQGIGASRDGSLWVMFLSQMQKWKDGKWSETEPAPWRWSPAHTVLETRDGFIAAATADYGLYLVFPGKGFRQFSRADGFPSDWVTSLCEDREGNLWVGTGNGGLAMLRAVNVTTFDPPDQWQGRAVLTVAAAPDGAIWAGTEGAGLYRFQSGVWSNYDERMGLRHRFVWSVNFDAQNNLRAGTWGGGVFVLKGSQFEQVSELQDMQVAALANLHRGGLCIGTSAGLLRQDADKPVWLARGPEIVSADVRTVTEAADGTIWFGMCGGGLGSYKDGKLRQFRRRDGLSSDFVQCLHVDSSNTLWIGTSGNGLSRFKEGRFTAITRRQGLTDDTICDIQEDLLGNFWISSHGGIMRISKAELDHCADQEDGRVRVVTYGLGDGLPTLQCSGGSQPAGCTTDDGRIWFATARGLVAIDPANVKTNPIPPPVVIEEMRVDGHPVTNRNILSETRVGPGRHRLEFDYAGLSFVAPERVSFKCRLEGWEKEWVDAGTKRVATYNYVPPGDYLFRVLACNNDGIWSETEASFGFSVLPFFWQTWWFRVLASLTAAAGIAGTVLAMARARMHRKLERIERQQALERERARIAQDIHDDLGASLTRISLLTQSTRTELNSPQQVGVQLDRIYATVRELTRAMDEIVWAVNPRHDTLDSLASYLGKFAQDYLRAAGIRCKLDVPVQLPACPVTAEVRHNIFLALKEALNNIVKHARASAVRIALALNENGFVLTVEDNGCGFVEGGAPAMADDSDRVERGHGVLNIKRRLSEIGGTCEIQSALHAGTRVKMEVPMELH